MNARRLCRGLACRSDMRVRTGREWDKVTDGLVISRSKILEQIQGRRKEAEDIRDKEERAKNKGVGGEEIQVR